MVEHVQTRVFRLVHDPRISELVGYLISQQDLAYNAAVDVLNRFPNTPVYQHGRYPKGLGNWVVRWRRAEQRASAPAIVHQSGARQAWVDNLLLQQERLGGLADLADSSRWKVARRTLPYRRRKREVSSLSISHPPIRRGDSGFSIMATKGPIFRTKKPVPDLKIRSFQLVEVHRDRRGTNGDFRKRRYALHLQVTVELPDPPALDAIDSPEEILGLDDSAKTRMAVSNGEVINIDDSRAAQKVVKMRQKASRKKSGSKRQGKVLAKAQKLDRKTRANRRHIVRQEARRLYGRTEPKFIAIESGGLPRSPRGLQDSLGANLRTKAAVNGMLKNASLSEPMQLMAAEARKRGVGVYTQWEKQSEKTCNRCRTRMPEEYDSQVSLRCRRCGHETDSDMNSAQALRDYAFSDIGRTNVEPTHAEGAPLGRRVRPSSGTREVPCDSHSANKPKSGEGRQGVEYKPHAREYNQGASLQARSPQGAQGAQRELVSRFSGKYTITDNIYSLINSINDSGLSEPTMVGYAAGMAHWATFAMARGFDVMPAKPAEFILYIATCLQNGYTPGSVKAYATGVSAYHRHHGLPGPRDNKRIGLLLRGMSNINGNLGRQAPGLTKEHLVEIEKTVFIPFQTETPEEAKRRGLKVLALITLMQDALLRRLEASRLVWDDIYDGPDGTGVVLVRKSKTDPYGEGAALFVSADTMRRLSAIRQGADGDESVFGWNPLQIHNRIKFTAERARLGEHYTSHSPRRGMAKDLVRNGTEIEDLMEAGRWTTEYMGIYYANDPDQSDGAAARFFQDNEPNIGPTEGRG